MLCTITIILVIIFASLRIAEIEEVKEKLNSSSRAFYIFRRAIPLIPRIVRILRYVCPTLLEDSKLDNADQGGVKERRD